MNRRLRRLAGQALTAVLAVAFAGIALARWARRRAPRTQPRSVLLVRFDLMGDVVNGLGAAWDARARWPEARISFMAPPAWTPIVRRCSAADEVLAFDGGAVTHWPQAVNPAAWWRAVAVIRSIRRRRFDLAVSLYGGIAGTVVALSGARERVGYRTEAPPFSFDRPLPGRRRNGGPHESLLAARLVSDAQPPWRTLDRTAGLSLPAALRAASRPLVVAHPGATHGRAKRWPSEHWRSALRALAAETGATMVIAGVRADAALGAELAASAPGTIDLTGRTTLDELMAVLHVADLVISVDSGPAHLARAMGTRVLALHGPTDVHLHGPGDPSCQALRVEIPCGPCYSFRGPAECAFGDRLCMEWLAPERVVQAARAMIPSPWNPAAMEEHPAEGNASREGESVPRGPFPRARLSP
ncbi:MAG: glycosyltransferase family 9 protein [Actinobacteria bacterium]|nr:glycosyltransferase family 9 protein [Actinomycetota bacterium]